MTKEYNVIQAINGLKAMLKLNDKEKANYRKIALLYNLPIDDELEERRSGKNHSPQDGLLSRDEKLIIKHLVKGLKNREIAKETGIYGHIVGASIGYIATKLERSNILKFEPHIKKSKQVMDYFRTHRELLGA